MGDWLAVSRKHHANAHWQSRNGFDFARTLQVVDILIPELSKLLPHHALAFVQQNEVYQPVALLGVGGETNLYVDSEGNWLGSYIPAALRSYPFALAAREEGDKFLCLKEEHLVSDGNAQNGSSPLFAQDGELDAPVARILGLLEQCHQARPETLAATQALADAGLFLPWALHIKRGEGSTPFKLEGLYHIDEQRLSELDTDAFAGLRRSGALLLAYAQLLSMAQIEQLTLRADRLGRQARARGFTGDLGDLLDDSNSINFETLQFDSKSE